MSETPYFCKNQQSGKNGIKCSCWSEEGFTYHCPYSPEDISRNLVTDRLIAKKTEGKNIHICEDYNPIDLLIPTIVIYPPVC